MIQERGDIGRRSGRGAGEELGRQAVRGSEDGGRSTGRTESRDEDAGGEVTATDDTDAAGGSGVPVDTGQGAGERFVRNGVFDDEAEGARATEIVVDLRCVDE